MKKRRFTEEQIAYALAQESTGHTTAELCRRLGVFEQTFYRWRKIGTVGVAELRRLKQLAYESSKLKLHVADLNLDKATLQDVLRKKSDSRPAPRAGRGRAGCRSVGRASGMWRAVRFTRDDSLRVSGSRAE